MEGANKACLGCGKPSWGTVCRDCYDRELENRIKEGGADIVGSYSARKSNLLVDTLSILTENRKDPRTDVRWVGSMDGSMALTWDEFESIAKETQYHSGFGATKIAMDLVVVGTDWWLERCEYDGSEWWEYDGSEWWEFKRVPEKRQGRPFMKVMGKHGATGDLEEINKSWEED